MSTKDLLCKKFAITNMKSTFPRRWDTKICIVHLWFPWHPISSLTSHQLGFFFGWNHGETVCLLPLRNRQVSQLHPTLWRSSFLRVIFIHEMLVHAEVPLGCPAWGAVSAVQWKQHRIVLMLRKGGVVNLHIIDHRTNHSSKPKQFVGRKSNLKLSKCRMSPMEYFRVQFQCSQLICPGTLALVVLLAKSCIDWIHVVTPTSLQHLQPKTTWCQRTSAARFRAPCACRSPVNTNHWHDIDIKMCCGFMFDL